MKKYKIFGSSVIIIEEDNSKAAPHFEKFDKSLLLFAKSANPKCKLLS